MVKGENKAKSVLHTIMKPIIIPSPPSVMNQAASPPYLTIKTPMGNRLTVIIKVNKMTVQARVPDSDIETLRFTEVERTTKASPETTMETPVKTKAVR